MEWKKQQLAKSTSSGSRSKSSGSAGQVNLGDSENITTQNSSLQKLYNNLSKDSIRNPIQKEIYRNVIYGEVKNGNITEADASALFDEFNL